LGRNINLAAFYRDIIKRRARQGGLGPIRKTYIVNCLLFKKEAAIKMRVVSVLYDFFS
jgi:hypothetical protein